MHWTGVSGGRKHGGHGGKCHNTFVRGPCEAPETIYMSYMPFTVLKFRVCFIGRVLRTPLFQLIVVMK